MDALRVPAGPHPGVRAGHGRREGDAAPAPAGAADVGVDRRGSRGGGGVGGASAACAAGNGWVGAHVGEAAAQWIRSADCAPAAAAVVVVLALGRGAVSRGMSARALVWLGETSFVTYLVHWPLLSLRS